MFYKETDFKESQMGKIPTDWNVVDASNFVDVLKGYAFSSEFFNGKKEGMPLIRIRDLGKKETESYYSGEYDLPYIVRSGDILVSMDGEFNVYTWDGPEGLLNQRVCKFSSKNSTKLVDRFLYYALQKPIKIIESQISQTTVKHLLDKDIEKIKIPFPSIFEQKKIAEVIGVVDLAVAKAGEVIAKTERLKKGLMQELLTKGIGHKEYKQTPLGKIPKEWDIMSLSDVFKLASGKPRPSEISEMTTHKASYPVYGGNGIMGYADEFLLDEETIVMGRVGEYCGSVYKTDKFSWITDNALYATEILSDFDLEFLKYLLTFLNLNKFKKKMGQPLLTQTIVYSIDIPCPPLSEQHKIAGILLELDRKLELEREEKSKLERIKRGLMDLLLTGKVRVKVD